jgi:histidinol-phosphate aminotransferase
MAAYPGGGASTCASEPVVRLSGNENPLGPSPKALAALREFLPKVHHYPDGSGAGLREALSRRFDVSATQVVLGNGSDEIIRMLGTVLLDSPEDEVVVGDPSFVVYDTVAKVAPCRLIKVPLDASYRLDLAAMTERISAHTRIVFVANPNNPTGTIVREPEMDRFLDDVPEETLVVLDEAYYEFAAGEEGYPNGLRHLRERRNVCVLRTFSKAYGLAGVRCGYGFASTEVADALERSRQPFNVSSVAQAAALAAMDDREHLKRTLEANRRGLSKLASCLRSSGAEVCESFANFVWADFGRPAKPLCDALAARGVLVRSGDIFGCPSCVRVSIGSDRDNDRFCEALAEIV